MNFSSLFSSDTKTADPSANTPVDASVNETENSKQKFKSIQARSKSDFNENECRW